MARSRYRFGDDHYPWVIMENHLHWIGVGPQLSKRVGEFKSFTATSMLKEMEKPGMKTMLQVFSYYKLRYKHDQEHQCMAISKKGVIRKLSKGKR